MEQSTETIKYPWKVERGDLITVHPDHPEITGEWRVIGDVGVAHNITTIDYSTPDGGEGVFALTVGQRVTVRTAITYTAPALLTPMQRDEVLLATTPRERTYLLAETAHRFGEIFDAVHAELQKARAADAACLRDGAAS